MKKNLPSLVVAFLLSLIMQAHATLIVYGIINGVVTTTSGGEFFRTTVGMPVSGYFSYDYDLLSAPDLMGNRTISAADPNARFNIVSSVGEGGGYGMSGLLQMTVDANGLPYDGSGQSTWDVSIGPSSVGLIADPGIYWVANVTYTITGVPDASATWLLLGIGMASVTGARRFFRRIRV